MGGNRETEEESRREVTSVHRTEGMLIERKG